MMNMLLPVQKPKTRCPTQKIHTILSSYSTRFTALAVLQMATVQSVAAVGLLNVGTQLSLAGKALEGNFLLIGAAGLAASVAWAFRRVGELDKFEKALKSKEGALR